MASVRDFFKRAFGSAVGFTKGASASAANATKGAFDSAVDVTRAALGAAVDITKETVTAYATFLRNLAKWSFIVAIGLLPLPIIGSVFHLSWMNGLYLLVLALIFSTLLMAASPLVILARLGYEHVKPFKWAAQLRAGFWFWSLLIVAYFWLVPVWNYPAAIPLIVIICIFLAVAFVRFGYSLDPKLFYRLMLALLLLLTLFCYMPASRSAAGTFVAWLDGEVAGFLTSPSHSTSKGPRRIGYALSSIGAIAFFDSTTSEPKVWYCESEEAGIELFDAPGYHPRNGQQLKPIGPAVVARIMKLLRTDAQQKMAEEEQMRARPHPPERIACDYSSLGAIAFFDPTTSEPRIWYYTPEDGMIELFDGPGYHPQYKGELKPITPDIVIQLRRQLKADTEKAAQEAQTRREELEKIAKEQGISLNDAREGVDRGKTTRAAKPPLIKAEDTQGRVEKQKDEIIRPQERMIEPEETSGTVLGPKSG
jgi:hypothetical protein